MADRPRWWKSGSVRNIVGACLGRAEAKFPVKIYWVDPNVTHEHRGREPFEGMEQNMSDFDQLSCSLLTREINALLCRKGGGTIWAGRSKSDECVDDASIENQFFYGA